MRPALTTLFPPALPRGAVWLIADGASLEAAYPEIDAALVGRPGLGLVLAVPEADVDAVRHRLTHEAVVAFSGKPAFARRVKAAAPALVIALGEVAVPAGLRAHRIRASGEIAGLGALMPAEGPPVEPPSPWQSWLVRLAAGAAIANLDDVRNRLGAPETILCLGNGPSSEDPRVMDFPRTCLFRVNWTWRSRGLLAQPDMVFTADPDLPPPGRRPILALPRRPDGIRLLARHCLGLRPPTSGYLFLDSTPPLAAEIGHDPIPTNGALMVALAAALRPARLAIAGLDLYRHPEGRYPGDPGARDGYSRQHSPACDLDLLRRSLAGYRGELAILSDALREALAQG